MYIVTSVSESCLFLSRFRSWFKASTSFL